MFSSRNPKKENLSIGIEEEKMSLENPERDKNICELNPSPEREREREMWSPRSSGFFFWSQSLFYLSPGFFFPLRLYTRVFTALPSSNIFHFSRQSPYFYYFSITAPQLLFLFNILISCFGNQVNTFSISLTRQYGWKSPRVNHDDLHSIPHNW